MSRAPTRTDYAVLGLRPGASELEIRDAYRRLAKIHHPDRNPGDPQALATFARLSESYAALRARSRSAAVGAAGRSSSARHQDVEVVAVADLPVGGSAWVPATAVLVGPGRVAALHPAAAGSAYPSAERVIRVERRRDGHHVFMPPQPSARWPLSMAADAEGLAVAALWVGDRQDQGPGHAAAARMPLRLMSGTVAEMPIDARGWVAAEALAVHPDGTWTLDGVEPVSSVPHHACPVRVVRDSAGYRVRSDLPAATWVPAHGGPERVAVLSAELGAVPPAPRPPRRPDRGRGSLRDD